MKKITRVIGDVSLYFGIIVEVRMLRWTSASVAVGREHPVAESLVCVYYTQYDVLVRRF